MKKIIGYELANKEPEVYKAVSMILFGNDKGSRILETYIPVGCSYQLERLEKCGVLNIWFRPVITNPPYVYINNCEIIFHESYIEINSAKISKEVFIDLVSIHEYDNTNRAIESVIIGGYTFSKTNIAAIANYYK